jgi:hypothetical protein
MNEQERERMEILRNAWAQDTMHCFMPDARFVLAQLDAASAEIERMRPVVEAARAYAHSPLPRRRYEVRQAAREYEEANRAR